MTIKYAKKAQILFLKEQVTEGVANLPAMSPAAWAISTAYTVNQQVLANNKIYICTVGGTSAGSGTGPNVHTGTVTDGSVTWKYVTTNQAWAISTAYTLGQQIIANNNVYEVITAGTSAGTGTGPSTTAADITDGTAHWKYVTSQYLATDAIAIFNSDYNTNLSNETFQYSGSELDRDEGVTITDKYAEASGETFMPATGTSGTPTSANFPLASLFKAAGAAVSYLAPSGPAPAQVKAGNDTASTTLLTAMISKISTDRSTKQKNYRFYDCRATVDLTVKSGSRAQLKFNLKGTPVDTLGQAFPDETPLITPNYGTQKTIIAPPLRLNSLVQAQIVTYGSLGFNTGTTDLPTPFTSTTKNIGFNELSAPNVFGFQYDRFLTTIQEGFAKSAIASDLTMTILEDGPDATWNPDSDFIVGATSGGMLAGYFALGVQWGSTPGQRLYIEFTKIQLMDVKNADISNYSGKTLTFKNTGNSIVRFA